MNTNDVGQYWNNNADAWTKLVRAGYDVYRDYLNTPAFFAMLPDVQGLSGLDVGCGEGHNTRLLARRGASLTAVDIAEKFITHATRNEQKQPLGIQYLVASATALPFEAARFDFVTSFMCLMDIPDLSIALQEISRVLKPDGFFQFSIAHPCFATPHRKNLRGLDGTTFAIEVGDYFSTSDTGVIEEWIFGAAPAELKAQLPKFRIPVFHHTLTRWFELLQNAGFRIDQLNEPCPDDRVVQEHPSLQDSSIVAYFLHLRCRKTL